MTLSYESGFEYESSCLGEMLQEEEDNFYDDFYDDTDTFDYSLESIMQEYVEKTIKNGFIPYFSQFCQHFQYENNDDNLELFETVYKRYSD